jgi:hypothetical protein
LLPCLSADSAQSPARGKAAKKARLGSLYLRFFYGVCKRKPPIISTFAAKKQKHTHI